MGQFKFSQGSLNKLKGVHPNLVKVVHLGLSLTDVDFGVTDGLRDMKKQEEYVAKGTSQTKNGRHLTGHAVDLTPYNEKGEAITGKLGNDPKNWHYFASVSFAMKKASQILKIPIEWGGDWEKVKVNGEWKDFKDGYHFQLPWKDYPLK